MAAFLYMPHLFFVAQHGLDHFEESMRAQHALTQLFTAEYSIRAYLDRHPERTLALLREWTRDPSEHVRRLVSEGTRPRLPWAPRLRAFQKDPRPVIELLELLKDDPSLYVRRSVANNLNDIGKDHPKLLVATAKRWLRGATPERRWIVNHALRSAVKRADAGALGALGYGGKADVAVRKAIIAPARARIGGSVSISFVLINKLPRRQRVMADLVVHFVKARGTGAKTFKLKAVDLPRAWQRHAGQEDRAEAADHAQTLSGCASRRGAAQWPAREVGSVRAALTRRSAPSARHHVDQLLADDLGQARRGIALDAALALREMRHRVAAVLEHVVIEHRFPDRALLR